MGIYIFISDLDRTSKRYVSDSYVNTEFQAALKYDSSLMIEEYEYMPKRKFFASWFSKTKPVKMFSIYHETPAYDGSAYQARLQTSASGKREGVIAYLHGIVNGAVANEIENSKVK